MTGSCGLHVSDFILWITLTLKQIQKKYHSDYYSENSMTAAYNEYQILSVSIPPIIVSSQSKLQLLHFASPLYDQCKIAFNSPVFEKKTYVHGQKKDKCVHATFWLTLAANASVPIGWFILRAISFNTLYLQRCKKKTLAPHSSVQCVFWKYFIHFYVLHFSIISASGLVIPLSWNVLNAHRDRLRDILYAMCTIRLICKSVAGHETDT